MKILDYILTLLFSVAVFWIAYFTTQDAFLVNFCLYSLAFVSFLGLYKRANKIGFRNLLFITLGLHLIGLFSFPTLSPDWSRFLWDGELLTRAIHPYANLPNELILESAFQSNQYLKTLYTEITPLSAGHYSCYPTINQFYFYIGALFSDNLLVNLVVLRLTMLITLAVGVFYAIRLLRLLNLNKNAIWLFALNPFVIIELSNNLHFEGVLVSFLIISIYSIYKNQLFKGSLFWSFAVGVKLTPLLLLPFLYRYLGFRKSVRFYTITIAFVAILLGLFIWPSNAQNFIKSISLYFSNFEFNASIFSLVKSIFYSEFGWETVKIIGPWLSKISLVFILLYALLYKLKTKEHLITAMLFGFSIYIMFSSTVHPWYIAIPLALSIFTPYRSFVVWSFTVMLSYTFYDTESVELTLFLTILEYVSFGVCFAIETIKKTRKPTRVLSKLEVER